MSPKSVILLAKTRLDSLQSIIQSQRVSVENAKFAFSKAEEQLATSVAEAQELTAWIRENEAETVSPD